MSLMNIFDFAVPKISVDFTPTDIIFRHKEKTIRLLPIVYLSKTDNPPLVLDVGSQTAPESEHIEVHIFSSDKIDTPGLKKEDCLKAFVMHALKELMPRYFIRPKILINQSALLNDRLCGYQEMVLKEAFLSAGAMECSFI